MEYSNVIMERCIVMNRNKLACPRCGNVRIVIKQCDGRTKSFTVYWIFCEECKFDGCVEIGIQAAQDVRQ